MSESSSPSVNLAEIEKTSQVVTVEGITLPWVRAEYRTNKVTESGEVFVSYETLEAVSEADMWASDFGGAIPDVGFREGLALEQAGLARKRTRGAMYGTPELKALISRLW